MTDVRPWCRLAPFCVAARVAASFARVNVAPLSCLALTRISVLHRARQDLEGCVGRNGVVPSENRRATTKPWWCGLSRYGFAGTRACDEQSATPRLTCVCCPAFRHWRHLGQHAPVRAGVGLEGVAATTLEGRWQPRCTSQPACMNKLLNGEAAPITGVSTGDRSCAGARPGRSRCPALYHWRHQAQIAGLNW